MKRTALKRKPRSPRELDWPAARQWRMAVRRTGCVMCRQFPVPPLLRVGREPDMARLEAHHVVGQRHLKREKLEHLLWHEANGLCLCEYHHQRHEHAVQRVPRSILPLAALVFADEYGFGWVLDKEYR